VVSERDAELVLRSTRAPCGRRELTASRYESALRQSLGLAMVMGRENCEPAIPYFVIMPTNSKPPKGFTSYSPRST
jgi:hypothetical protein